jgi:hypothetical protein
MAEPSTGAGWRNDVPALLLAAVALGVVVRAVLVALPPLFVTDVAYYNAQAVSHLLGGVDPYGASYSVPPSLATPGAGFVFAYLPGVFAFLVPGDMGQGARLGLVACDIVVAASLILFKPKQGWLMASVFLLLPPVVVFSTSFLNDSLPAIAFLSLAMVLELRGSRLPAGIALGLALASSQEAWFVLPVYIAYSVRKRSFAPVAASILTAVAVLLPFVAWNASAFVSDTIIFQFQREAVPLLSLGPFGTNINPSLQGLFLEAGVGVPLAVRGALTALSLGYIVWRSKPGLDYLIWGSASAVALSLFLLAGDFFWSYLELPFVLGLFWAALRLEAHAEGASTLKEAESAVAAPSK